MILALLMTAVLAAPPASDVTVVLPMEATARGTELTLGEIATIHCVNDELAQRVGALDLGYTPAPGFSRLMHAHRIRQEVARVLPGTSVAVVGEAACRVRPEVVRVEAAEIEGVARQELQRLFAGRDVSFLPRDPIAAVTVPAGSAPPALSVRLDPVEPKTGAIAVPVRIAIDGAPYRTVWTNWNTARYEVVPVLTRSLRSGERIQSFHLESRRVLKSATHKRKVLPASLLSGAVAARDLQAGEPVTELDVHRPTIVGVGDDLYLEVKKGAVTARVAAVALGAGAIGDRIRVRATSNGQEHSAVLVSRDLVRIDLGSR
ncbi:MAG: flagellar basal body P-ring formation chaperone FlgA [Planctomycetota bacterium]